MLGTRSIEINRLISSSASPGIRISAILISDINNFKINYHELIIFEKSAHSISMKRFLVAKQGESKRLVKVSLKLVREIVFPVVIRDSKLKI